MFIESEEIIGALGTQHEGIESEAQTLDPGATLEQLNRTKYPYFRDIFRLFDIDTLERVNFSYVRLPESYKYGEASGRKACPISTRELNDKYMGVAQKIHSKSLGIMGMTDNHWKNKLLTVR